MKKNHKKLLSLVLTVLVIAASLTAGMIAYAGSPVAINATNFPDANFRTIVLMECDEDEDGYLSDDEIQGVTLFSVTGYLYDIDEDAEIESLKGIEYFTNLRTLRCGGIGLTSLDVSKLTSLTWLDCMGNNLETLDVSKNTALRTLNCQSNDLSVLNVAANTQLVSLSCSVNHLTALDVTHNTLLETLQVHQNELTTLNLSQNTALTSLHCSKNHLQELDLSANTALANVTSNRIGEQKIAGTATVSENTVFVDMPFSNRTRIISTSLDVDYVAYNGASFYTEDFTRIADGIDYEYNTGAADAEPMTVHIDVNRDFFIVRYYTNENKTTMLSEQVVDRGVKLVLGLGQRRTAEGVGGQQLGDLAARKSGHVVDRGANATEPDITSTPQCKTFVRWSETSANIQADKDIYAIWKDDHVFRVTDFGDNTVVLTCLNGCGTEQEILFSELVGAAYGDSNYNEAIDLNADGIINGRDLARLKAHQF